MLACLLFLVDSSSCTLPYCSEYKPCDVNYSGCIVFSMPRYKMLSLISPNRCNAPSQIVLSDTIPYKTRIMVQKRIKKCSNLEISATISAAAVTFSIFPSCIHCSSATSAISALVWSPSLLNRYKSPSCCFYVDKVGENDVKKFALCELQ